MGVAQRVVVVCGYGCHLTPELTRYLDRVVRFVNEKQPALIVLCGGYTQRKSAPGTSEAALMAIYIRERISHVPEFVIEDDSYTTYDNLAHASAAIWRMLPRRPELLHAEVTIFCEATRALKVALLARRFFGLPPAKLETDSWELMHPLKELVATLYDAVSLSVPYLARRWRRQRIEKSKTI